MDVCMYVCTEPGLRLLFKINKREKVKKKVKEKKSFIVSFQREYLALGPLFVLIHIVPFERSGSKGLMYPSWFCLFR